MATKKTEVRTSVNVGDVLSESSFYTVGTINPDGSYIMVDDLGNNIKLSQKYVENILNSAHNFKTTEKINKTIATELVLANANVAMTVCFNKQVDKKDVQANIMSAYSSSTPVEFEKAVKKAVSEALEGEERVIVGRHHGKIDNFGRIKFVDMKLPKAGSEGFDSRMRLVDPRTINWLIVNNVKYLVS